MVPQGIPSKINGIYNDNFSKGVEIELKSKGDCISEAFFVGQVTGGINFKSSDGLFCEIVLDVGPHWNLIRGAQQRNENSQNDFKSIQTQTAYAEEGQMFVWSHPIDLEFKVGNINGWPKGIIKVWRLDDTNKIDASKVKYIQGIPLISYGVVNFPREDGYHRLEVDTWSPMGDWQFSNFTFFLGTQPRLPNLDLSKLADKRNEILGVSSGKVIIEIEFGRKNKDKINKTPLNNHPISMKGTLVLLLLTLSVASAYNSIPLPYQAHSMNDLDLMLQELLKGTSDFKFDVSLASEDSCSNYSLWEKDYSQCGYYGFGIKTCCLALRGDCSQQPVFQQSFNVTTDMLKLLRNPTYQFILAANTTIQKYARTKYFAFNFQYSSREVVATTFFIYEFLKTVKELNLNIKFVTGTTSLIEHYDNKCAVSGACNEMEQYIADSDIILQDKGSKQSKHRAVQFNTAATNLQKYCTIGFPSYAHKSELPMQLWEPSYQDMVTSTLDLFWSSLCPKTRIQDPENRFRITSNLNSEHIAVSLQSANKTTSKHAPKYVPLKHTFSSTTNSLIEHSSQLNATFITRFDITRSKFVLLTYKGAFFDKVVSTPQYFDSEITKLTVSESFLLVEQQSSNKLKIFAISPNDLSLTLLHDFSSSNLFSSPCDYLGSTLTQEVYESSSPLLVSACLLNQQIIIQTLDIVTLKQSNDSNNTLITSSLEYDAQNFKDIAAGRENGKLKIIFTFQATNPQNDVQEIFFSYLSSDAFTLALENFTISSQPNHYGDHSSLRILSRNNKLYFIQVSGNGSSWSGVFMNNGDWSKCSLYSEQNFIALRNVPHTATYLYGQLSDLVNRIETAQFINSCDNRIISAKFYNGDKPSVTVIDDSQGRPTAYVLFNHVPYDQLPLLTTLFLGANNYEQSASAGSTSSTELVSFDLIEYDIFDLSF